MLLRLRDAGDGSSRYQEVHKVGRQTLDTAPCNARHGDRLWTQRHAFSKNEYGSVYFRNHKPWKCFVN